MGLTGGRSGFRTVRDVLLFVVGAVVAGVHLASTYSDPASLQVPVILTAGGLMGAPYVLRKDEGKD